MFTRMSKKGAKSGETKQYDDTRKVYVYNENKNDMTRGRWWNRSEGADGRQKV